MDPRLEETIYLDFPLYAASGALADADSTPTSAVYENAVDTANLSPTVTKRTSLTGHYRVPVACTAANGFEVGKSYNVWAYATVGGVVTGAVVGRFIVRPAAAVANVTQINGSTNLTSDGTATAGGASTITLATGVTYGTDLLKDRAVTLVGGTGAGQSRVIIANTNATPSVLTVHRAWDTNPSTDTTYVIDATAAARVATGIVHDGTVATVTTVTNQLAASAIAAAVEAAIFNEGDATALLAAISAKVETFLINDGDATATLAAIATAVRTNLTTELGRIDATISSRSSHTAANVVTAMGTGMFLSAIPWNASWDAEVQSEVADALAVYDPPTNAEMEARTVAAASYALASHFPAGFSGVTITSGILPADVKKVNAVAIDGTGTEGDEWVPA